MVFIAHLMSEEKEMATVVALRRSHSIISTVHAFYRQFTSKALLSLAEQRKSVEKDIKALTQLASWKDINVHALQQSAKHIHRQLYRKIRKFRDVLRQPITDYLKHEDIGVSGSGSGQQAAVHAEPHDSVEYCSNRAIDGFSLQKVIPDASTVLLQKFSAVMRCSAIRMFLSKSTFAVDDLSIAIFATLDELSKTCAPRTLEPSHQKRWYSSLLNRKRKAWNDLWKEFKRVGIPSNVKPEALAMHRNRRWLMEQPKLPSFKWLTSFDPIAKIDLYANRNVRTLTDLLASLSNHHPDISTREFLRGVTYFESGFSLAMRARSKLSASLAVVDRLRAMEVRLITVVRSGGIYSGDVKDLAVLRECHTTACGLVDALEEMTRRVDDIRDLSSGDPLQLAALDELHDWITRSVGVRDTLSSIMESSGLIPLQFISEDDAVSITSGIKHLRESANFLQKLSSSEPKVSIVSDAVRGWLIDSLKRIHDLQPAAIHLEAAEKPQQSIDALLVIAQDLAAFDNALDPDSDADDSDHVRLSIARLEGVTRLLRLGAVIDDLGKVLERATRLRKDSVQTCLRQLLPFVNSYIELAVEHLSRYAKWLMVFFKLLHISSSVLKNVSLNGFCTPKESEQSQQSNGPSEATEGTGFGQGAGDENVSNQIEEDSQVEGLQGDEEDSGRPEHEDEGKGDALDTDHDFDGVAENVEVPEKDEDEDESDAEGLSDIEDVFDQNAADDPGAVDEEFWKAGDDEPDVDKPQDDSHSLDNDAKRPSESSKPPEVTAKDSADGITDAEMDHSVEDRDTNGDELDKGDEHPDTSVGEPLQEVDDHRAESPTADQAPEDTEAGQDLDIDINDEQSMQVDEGDSGIGSPLSDNAGADDIDDTHTHQDGTSADEDDTPEQENEAATTGPDLHAADGPSAESNSLGADVQGNETADEQSAGGANASVTQKGEGARDKELQSSESFEQSQLESKPHSQPDAGDPGSDHGPASSTDATKVASVPNPLRSLGDALREVRRRFEEIEHTSDQEVAPQRDVTKDERQAALEYAPPEDLDNQMQALGPAGEEKAERLDTLTFEEQKDVMDVDEVDEGVKDAAQTDVGAVSTDQSRHQIEVLDVDKFIDAAMKETRSYQDDASAQSQRQILLDKQDSEDLDMTDNYAKRSKDVELELTQWRATGQPEANGQRLWQMYDSLTHHLSFALCEQLRLILEPTKATRLQGDFRTGKRLNMKKIIPYIASNYTKDKIWLRRVRPSKREYQVLLALDDSRSMAEAHAVHLAFQTLALVAKALGRLEVGDVAVMSFGQHTRVLHDFDAGPFSEQVGALVMSAFSFGQTATDVRSLLSTTLDVLLRARARRAGASAAASELWQLALVISDGICQDHEALRALLRQAADEKVLIVFIVVDAHHSGEAPVGADGPGASQKQNSILHMNQAEYRMVNGRMELHMQRYLDSFPFDYFVVVKSIESLPDVLSDTLRQFFERLTES